MYQIWNLGEGREGGNEIDARVIEDPKEASKIFLLDIVQDKRIAIGCAQTVLAANGDIRELPLEHGRFPLEKKSRILPVSFRVRHTSIDRRKNQNLAIHTYGHGTSNFQPIVLRSEGGPTNPLKGLEN